MVMIKNEEGRRGVKSGRGKGGEEEEGEEREKMMMTDDDNNNHWPRQTDFIRHAT